MHVSVYLMYVCISYARLCISYVCQYNLCMSVYLYVCIYGYKLYIYTSVDLIYLCMSVYLVYVCMSVNIICVFKSYVCLYILSMTV